MAELIDIRGKTFGRLKVLDRAENTKRGSARWLCKCECGKELVVIGRCLRNGHTKSCGCYHDDCARKLGNSKKTHGMEPRRLYNIWRGMLQRCEYPKHEAYANYGGRGISICKEWHDFEVFRDWAIGNGYSNSVTIDRINVDGDYSPDNCKWSTRKEQAKNKRNSILITIGGETHSVSEWAHIKNINVRTIYSRLRRGWDAEKILNEKGD